MIGKIIIMKIKSRERSFRDRKYYCTQERSPFYKIAKKYIPVDGSCTILDIGAGEGDFANLLNLYSKHKNVFLLDGNTGTVEKLREKYANVIHYKAPRKLPFTDHSVDYIHSSHLIEHLNSLDLFQFLKEIDRVLAIGGIFIVSSPMLWKEFYSDLSHIRPYNPEILINYFCDGSPKNRSSEVISKEYSVQELVYRYNEIEYSEGLGSEVYPIDFIIQLLKKIISLFGIKRYEKNGYTIVLKKK